MSLLTFLLGNWRVTAEAILLLLFISTLTLYRNAESEIDALKTQYQLENAVREAQAKEVKNKSDSTLKRINDEHKTVVEQAEKNAWRNFTKRYGTGTGFNGCGSIGLRLPASQSSSDCRKLLLVDNPLNRNILQLNLVRRVIDRHATLPNPRTRYRVGTCIG